jgi:hypothetical protein
LNGDEFLAGDKVKLVNPVTGQFQSFTVASSTISQAQRQYPLIQRNG